jgi:hypothetical protein
VSGFLSLYDAYRALENLIEHRLQRVSMQEMVNMVIAACGGREVNRCLGAPFYLMFSELPVDLGLIKWQVAAESIQANAN